MFKMKTFRYRLYPNETQIIQIEKTIGCVRFVYNYSLAEQKKLENYWYVVEALFQSGMLPKNNWKSDFFSKYEAIKAIPELKKKHIFLKDADSIALQSAIENLASAYDHYYKGRGGHPRFKSKRNEVQSYTTKSVNGNIRIIDDCIKLPKLGVVKFAKSREVEGRIKKVTIKRTSSGKYYMAVLCEIKIVELPAVIKKVGIDVGLKDYATTSDGEVFENPKYFRKSENRLKFLQRSMNRKIRGSKNYEKARMKVAKEYEKISNRKMDFLHKLSTRLINENQVIVIEDLRVSNMKKIADYQSLFAKHRGIRLEL